MALGRKTGGRKKGTPNKSTAALRAIAQQYDEEAVEKLVHLMRNSLDEKVQHAAAVDLIEIGHGKPKQTVEDVTNHESSRTEQLLAQLPEALAALGEGLPQ
jgi:hypothetical protein